LVNEMEQVGVGRWTETLASRHRTQAHA